jgi:hypothetical protein
MALAGGRHRPSTGWVLLDTPAVPLGSLPECAAAAARPRAARAVLSCAGAYISGAAGSNECPAGSVRIETEAACRTAAAAAGKTIVPSLFVETDSNYPRGCYYYTDSITATFNAHAVGAGNSNYQLLCATATTTSAPPPHQCARVCTGTWQAHPADHAARQRW